MRTCARQRGLTLVEVLASVVILSAVAAAGASILRDAGGSGRRAALHLDARDVLERWRAIAPDERPEEWEWTDERGRMWIVRRVLEEPQPPKLEAGETRASEFDRLVWEVVTVEVAETNGASAGVVLRRRGLTMMADTVDAADVAGRAPGRRASP